MGTFIIVMLCIAFYAFIGGITYKACSLPLLENEIDDDLASVIAGIFWPFGLFFIFGVLLINKLKDKKWNK